jgi:hypothetical protein
MSRHHYWRLLSDRAAKVALAVVVVFAVLFLMYNR